MNGTISKKPELSKRGKKATVYRRVVTGNVNGKSVVQSDEQMEATSSTALISRLVVKACSISSRAFRQRSSMSRERSWPRETS